MANKDFTKDGKCTKCGNCCANIISVTPKEIKRISKYVKENNIKPIHHGDLKTENAIIDSMCPFLKYNEDNTKTCIIYNERPEVCKKYICSESELDLANKFLIDIQKGKLDAKEFLENRKDMNLQQELFPDEYSPATGDFVIVNNLNKIMAEKYANKIFVVTGKMKKLKNKTKIQIRFPHNDDTIWLDIKNLTLVETKVNNYR